MHRRTFLKAATGTTLSSIASTGWCLALDDEQKKQNIKAGIITDLHYGNLTPNGNERLEVFAKAVAKEKPNYVIQLGDFCHPEKQAKKLMKTWNSITCPRHHVLGNHDMDKGTKADIQKLWGMKNRYYDFDINGWKFIVLDMNNLRKDDKYIPYAHANFYVNRSMRAWPDPEQLKWLNTTLVATELPVLIYTHQPLCSGHKNRPDTPQHRAIQDIIKKHRTKNLVPKVRAAICGHHHLDWHRQIDGVHHICINSASYLWHKGRPWGYKDALFTFMEIKNGRLTLSGMKTTWNKQPQGIDKDPTISERNITFT